MGFDKANYISLEEIVCVMMVIVIKKRGHAKRLSILFTILQFYKVSFVGLRPVLLELIIFLLHELICVRSSTSFLSLI